MVTWQFGDDFSDERLWSDFQESQQFVPVRLDLVAAEETGFSKVVPWPKVVDLEIHHSITPILLQN